MKRFSKILCLLFVTLLSANSTFALSPIKLRQPIDINLGNVDMDVSDNHPFNKKIGNRFSNSRIFRVNSGFKITSGNFFEKICIIQFYKSNYTLSEKVLRNSLLTYNSKLYISLRVIRI